MRFNNKEIHFFPQVRYSSIALAVFKRKIKVYGTFEKNHFIIN